MPTVTLTLNGKPIPITAPPDESLLSVLRNRLHLMGTHFGCGEGACGACTVLVDGKAVRSCMTPLSAVLGTHITTVEGLAHNGRLTAVQQAFVDEGAMQCGYCTSGMVVRATSLLSENPNPTTAQIISGMNGNLCRCGTYPRIVAAVRRAAQVQQSAQPKEGSAA